MTFLLESKEKLKQFYAQYSMVVLPVLKFMLAFAVFKAINLQLPFVETLDNIFVLLILSLICSIMSVNTTVVFGMILLVGQCYGVGIEIAGFALALILVIFILYIRFVPKDTTILLLTPIAFVLKIPCVIPIGYGLTRTPASAISAGCGVVIYYFMDFVNKNAALLTGAEKEKIAENLNFMLDHLMKNQDMMMNIIAFATVLLIVNMIRRLSVDYAWYIAIGVGAISYIVIMIAGNILLDVNCPMIPLLIGTLGAVIISLILEFFLLNVDYTRTETLQFEDDEYYYYVKAIPKMSISKKDVIVKTITGAETEESVFDNVREEKTPITKKEESTPLMKSEDLQSTQVIRLEGGSEEKKTGTVVSQETIALDGFIKPYQNKTQYIKSTDEEEQVESVDFESRLEESLKDL